MNKEAYKELEILAEQRWHEICALKSINAKLVEACKAYMTIDGCVANEYWDIESVPTNKLNELVKNALELATEGNN